MQRTVQLRRIANAHLSRPLRAICPLPHRPRVLQSRLAGLSGVPRALPLLLRTFHLHEAAARGLHSARLVSRPTIPIRIPNPLHRSLTPFLPPFDASSLPLCLHICMYTNFIATSCMQSLFRCCFPLSTFRLSAATGNDGAELSSMLHFPATTRAVKRCYLPSPYLSPPPSISLTVFLKSFSLGANHTCSSWLIAHGLMLFLCMPHSTCHPAVLCRCHSRRTHKGCPRLRGGSLPAALTCVLSVLCPVHSWLSVERVNHI